MVVVTRARRLPALFEPSRLTAGALLRRTRGGLAWDLARRRSRPVARGEQAGVIHSTPDKDPGNMRLPGFVAQPQPAVAESVDPTPSPSTGWMEHRLGANPGANKAGRDG